MNLTAVMSAVVALMATAAANMDPTTAPLTEPTTTLPDSAEAVTVLEASEAQGLPLMGDAATMDSLAEVGAGDKVTQADSHDMVSSDAMQDEMSAHESSTNSEIALDEVTTSTAGGQARTEQVYSSYCMLHVKSKTSELLSWRGFYEFIRQWFSPSLDTGRHGDW
jgi:hypothetical protein